MSLIKLQANELGSVKLCPVTACEVRVATNEMVVIVIQYVETIEEFDSGHWKQLQAILPVKRALELAANLEKAATLFLESHPETVVQ
ncbi:MAG TPA: hypothetical protein VGI45_21270 [Terracidiphilus sp.]